MIQFEFEKKKKNSGVILFSRLLYDYHTTVMR
jgi:hypothetical protein